MYNGLSAIDDELFLRIAEHTCSYQTPKLQKNRKGQCCSSVFTSGGRCVDWTDCMVPGLIFSSCQHKDLNMTCAKERLTGLFFFQFRSLRHWRRCCSHAKSSLLAMNHLCEIDRAPVRQLRDESTSFTPGAHARMRVGHAVWSENGDAIQASAGRSGSGLCPGPDAPAKWLA